MEVQRARKSFSSGPIVTSSNVAILGNSMPLLPGSGSEVARSSSKSNRASYGLRNVVVMFDASRELTTNALEWSLDRIVQSGDVLTFLGILHQLVTPSTSHSPLKKGIANLLGYKARMDQTSFNGVNQRSLEEEAARKMKLCNSLITDVQKTCVSRKVKLDVRIIAGHRLSLVAVHESRKIQPLWIILDRNLKRQRKFISEQLLCNIIVMDRNNEGKILKLCKPVVLGPSLQFQDVSSDSCSMLYGVCQNAESSRSTFVRTSSGDSDGATSTMLSGPSDSEPVTPSSASRYQVGSSSAKYESSPATPKEYRETSSPERTVLTSENIETDTFTMPFTPQRSVETVDTFTRAKTEPVPLCSVCKIRSADFKRQTRKFTYSELEDATDNFSEGNFVAEGGFGFVYKGILRDGQNVAVKQHKLASTQGDKEFCAEVEVLSGAQHINLVTLLGFCIEDGRRILVYEFVCNKSLEWHLSAKRPDVLPWNARQAIAIGAARGLRYLHEECRVGTIIHRDFRPNNILLTHDYVPMVGDFGLARWQGSGEEPIETKVIGTLGYLSPEYASSGQVTEKADVYSFGVILLELITGRKAITPGLSAHHILLTEWARPKLEVRDAEGLLDPRLLKDPEPLENTNTRYEIQAMIHAAAYCLRRDPAQRPRMSQVLRILEGEKDEVPSSFNWSASWDPASCAPRPSSARRIPRVSSKGQLSYREMIN